MKSQTVGMEWWNKFLPNKIKFTILHHLEIKVDKSQQNHGYKKWNRGRLATSPLPHSTHRSIYYIFFNNQKNSIAVSLKICKL